MPPPKTKAVGGRRESPSATSAGGKKGGEEAGETHLSGMGFTGGGGKIGLRSLPLLAWASSWANPRGRTSPLPPGANISGLHRTQGVNMTSPRVSEAGGGRRKRPADLLFVSRSSSPSSKPFGPKVRRDDDLTTTQTVCQDEFVFLQFLNFFGWDSLQGLLYRHRCWVVDMPTAKVSGGGRGRDRVISRVLSTRSALPNSSKRI